MVLRDGLPVPATVAEIVGTAQDFEPAIRFLEPGRYTLRLVYATQSCGNAHFDEEVIISDGKTAILSPDISLCTPRVYNFSTTAGPTRVSYSPNDTDLGETYLWTIGGGGSGFENGTSSTSKYPSIRFDDYATYTVTVVVTNQCGASAPVSQVITFIRSPDVNAGPDQTVCNTASVTLAGTISDNTLPFTWLGGTGIFTPNRQTLGATYTPSATEVAAGTVTLTLRATTTLVAPCDVITDEIEITIRPANTVTSAPTKSICSGLSVDYTPTSAIPGTTFSWTMTGNPGNVSGASVSGTGPINDVLANPGTNIAVVTYTIVATSNNCPGPPFTFEVSVVPPPVLTATAPTTPICSNAGTNIQLISNLPNTRYTWSSANVPGVTGNTSNTVSMSTDIPLNDVLVNTTTTNQVVTYTITPATAGCGGNPIIVSITVFPAITNNTLSSGQTICGGSAPATITGSVPTGGNGSAFTFQWESSIDGGNTYTAIAGATDQDYASPPINTTTYFRRVVSNAVCIGAAANFSVPAIVSVNQDAIANFTATNVLGCAPFVLTAANIVNVTNPANATYTWFAGTIQIGTGIDFPGYTISTQGTTVRIRLVATSQSGCAADEFEMDFTTRNDFNVGFTQSTTAGCGPLLVQFTNTSTNLTDATFEWDFGNGTTSTAANPPGITFQPAIDGEDITYTITLRATTACGVLTTTATVLVRANARAAFSPNSTQGCAPFNVTFTNTSRGGNLTFTYDFGDGSPQLTTTSLANVSHIYNVTEVTDFTVRMTATNECTTAENSYVIRVSPNTVIAELVVNGNNRRGCAPYTVTFSNNSRGASSFIYDFKDGSTVQSTTSPETVTHTFTRPGTYEVELFATNGCSQARTTETIVVLEQPLVAFAADKTISCINSPIRFTNTSVNAISYLWDFGDGTTSTEFQPVHTYAVGGTTYTVSLTAINSLGCPQTTTFNNYISVINAPTTAFQVNPFNEITIPDRTFSFTDQSTDNPVSWAWTFGDGATATSRNPTHTYKDPGTYIVRLTTTNRDGCASSSTQSVRIVAVPGILNLPNAFMPASQKGELQTFMAKGTGIREWRMTVLNKWGQVLWETTKLDAGNSPAEGWDGTYRGQPQPQGTYYWKIEVKFINETEWKGAVIGNAPPKKTGVIYLIR